MAKKNPTQKTFGNVLWSGRLESKPEEEAFAFQSSIQTDKRMAEDDIKGSRAHAAMLKKQKIISSQAASLLDKELEQTEKHIKNGALPVSKDYEDIHSFVEANLTKKLGDEGRMIHSGRSRNDQTVLDLKLYLKRTIPLIQDELKKTISVILDTAETHTYTIMPGLTHLQAAQPVTMAYHLCAWACSLLRDITRFEDALIRMNECPLGSGALAGSGLPLDRAFVSKTLGFARPTLNAMDSVADRDFAVEFASASALTMIHLSRFCEDACIWASAEFGFIEFSESWSTGSSIMPQKKNPDFAELIRGKSGRTTGNLVALLTMLKGLPYAYNKDMQEDKEQLFDSLDTLFECLKIFRGFMPQISFNIKKMKAACSGSFMEATDAADYLVKKGLPFRKAHETVALLVRDCIEAGYKNLYDLKLSEFKKRSKLFEDDINKILKPFNCVKARKLPGGTAPQEVKRQIKVIRKAVR